MLASALMPTLSRALSLAGDGNWSEVCTAQGGIKKVLVVPSAEGVPEHKPTTLTKTLEHCPFCGLGSHTPTLPAAPIRVHLPGAVWLLGARSVYCQASRPSPVWRAAQPRAPPVGTQSSACPQPSGVSASAFG